ncbi:exo-beta--glucanase [Phaffia rhodozyma]|uniref:glucan 1,3-beta-glucosidase n=1 Tax=Phaffia rhodozyma TaxID=264483 RepID=A0A0F7SI91_PHARH|nr:exo-beta--glucanase [Phaffia rhodozyma]
MERAPHPRQSVRLLSVLLACSLFNPTAAVVLAVNETTVEPKVIRGINLGGWLVSEPWITPSIYTTKRGVDTPVDEWSLVETLGKDTAWSVLSDHWSSFYTKADFENIKMAGLNALRIPLGYWAVDLLDSESYVSGQFPYLINAVQWAGELGLDVMVDLHGAPGSQNGQDNSGKQGPVLFTANQTNYDRTYRVLKNLTEEFVKPEYGGVVKVIEILNEPRLHDYNQTTNTTFSMSDLKAFYAAASDVIRFGSDNGLTVAVHDAFWGPQYWNNYDPTNNQSYTGSNPSWLQIDTHQYYAFAPYENLPRDEILDRVCNMSKIFKQSTTSTPRTVVGEWSLETGTPPNISTSTASPSRAKRTWLRTIFEAQLAAYSPSSIDTGSNGNSSSAAVASSTQAVMGWYFWCWKTEYNIDTWSYLNGINNGYIPSNLSDSSQLVFPILTSGPNAGCINASTGWQAAADPDPQPPSWGGGSGSGWNPYNGAARLEHAGKCLQLVGLAVGLVGLLI